MAQRFKSIYFADHPAATPTQRHLKIAFGAADADLFQRAQNLSGQDLRELLGFASYESLCRAAGTDGETVNAYCLKVLREQLAFDFEYTAIPETTAPNGTARLTGIQATFKGGESEPLHRWYPLLEGYSPQFVETILHHYAPNAKTVFDPFSGTGTTPLTASFLGRRSYYAEINPLLQFLTAAKVKALFISHTRRTSLSVELDRLADGFPCHLTTYAPAARLHQSYDATFGRSQFFDAETYERVLRSRTFLDDLACRDPFLAALVTVAVLASLIPGSLLTRAGDLRYRTPRELSRDRLGYVANVQAQLALMAADLRRLQTPRLSYQPLLVVEDARNIGRLPPLGIEAVVTSPPYLNGTNYFRNTKLELWFLGSLRTQQDLAGFRARAVAAGINDVSSRRQACSSHPSVSIIVEQLSQHAYDPRIPKMVQSYFQDMTAMLDGLVPHLVDGATIAVDIGDSAYAGIHVPTDQLLLEMLREHGFHLEDEVLLRRRLSRGGRVLRQALLVLRYHTAVPPTLGAVGRTESWRPEWEEFKQALPHQRTPYAKRNWGHPLHSLCSYQGKMKPSLAAHLVRALVPEGGSILDPFAGVATIPFEAAISGRKAYGFDISPAAVVIGIAKLGRADWTLCDGVLRALEDAIKIGSVSPEELAEAQAVGFNGRISDYFNPATLREVLLARRYFAEHPPSNASEALVMASLLHILHGNRPYALSRRSHPITPFAPSGDFEYRALLPRLIDKVARSLEAGHPVGFVEGEMVFQDATSWWPQHIQNLDAVVTSPPFFDSTRFYSANWMRLWFAGWTAKDFQSRPRSFVDERQKEDFSIYEPILRQARERLRPGGLVALHLGKSPKCDMADALSRIARPWFRVADRFSESVRHCESHGIRDKGTVEEHQYLLLV